MLSPVSPIECAEWTIQSRIASATVGSPLMSYQLDEGYSRGYYDGFALVTVLDYVEQDRSLLGVELDKEQVVEYKKLASFDFL